MPTVNTATSSRHSARRHHRGTALTLRSPVSAAQAATSPRDSPRVMNAVRVTVRLRVTKSTTQQSAYRMRPGARRVISSPVTAATRDSVSREAESVQ